MSDDNNGEVDWRALCGRLQEVLKRCEDMLIARDVISAAVDCARIIRKSPLTERVQAVLATCDMHSGKKENGGS